MKKHFILLIIPTVFFFIGCVDNTSHLEKISELEEKISKLEDNRSQLEIIISSDCKKQLKGNSVKVDIFKQGGGDIGSVLVNVGDKRGMVLNLEKGKYRLTCNEQLDFDLEDFFKFPKSWKQVDIDLDGVNNVKHEFSCF